MEVIIEGEEYKKCSESAKNRWSNKKKGNYGRGILNTKIDPYKTERTGLIGELALSKITGAPIDFDYKEGGDAGFDMFIPEINYKIDIKTAYKPHSNYTSLLIEYITEYGKHKNWKKCDMFIKAELIYEQSGIAKIKFIGCISATRVDKNKENWIREGKFGQSYNIAIPLLELTPIEKLFELIEKLKDKKNAKTRMVEFEKINR